MCKRNKACIYTFIVVMVLQIIIPALSVILETSYTLTSEAADDIIATWENIGAEGSRVTAKFYTSGKLIIEGEGKIKNFVRWEINGNSDCRTGFKSVEIMDGVTTIGIQAFQGCVSLTQVKAKNVKNIEKEAFINCRKLESIIMNNVKTVGNSAFEGCTKLTVTIPHKIESIGNKAFYNVNEVKGDIDEGLVLGNNLTRVGSQAFRKVGHMKGSSVVLTSGADTAEIYADINSTFPKGTTLYMGSAAFKYTHYNNGSKHFIQSIKLTEPKPLNVLYVNKPLNLKKYRLEVEFENGTKLVTCFKKSIFGCNYEDGTQFQSPGTINVNIQFGKILNYVEPSVTHSITVKNNPIKIKEIQIKNLPDKNEYMVGDSLDTKGLEVVGIDTYGTEILLDKDQYTCSPTSFATPGTKTITVRYKENPNLKATFQITVKPRYTAEIISYPNKMTYKVNEELDLKGLEVKVTYPKTNLISEVFTLDDIDAKPKNGTKLTKVGTQTIKMTSNDGRKLDLGSFNVTVTKETKKVKSIEVKSNTPKRKSYIEGETLDISGLKVIVHYTNGDTETIDNGFNTNTKHGDTLNKNNKKVNVSYEGQKTSYSITVEEKVVTKIQPQLKEGFRFVYTEGEKLDLKNLNLKVIYNDRDDINDIIEVVGNSNITTNPANGDTLGDVGVTTVKINYLNKETKLFVFVNEKELLAIAAANLGNNEYIEGTNFNAEDPLFHVQVKRGPTLWEELHKEAYTVVDGDNLKLGQKTVTISYEENGKTVTTTTPVTVTPKQLEKIEVTREPNKTTYIQGQNFDSTGMQVTVTYNSGKTAIINNYSVPNGQNLTVGMTSVKIVYTENGVSKEVEQPITVTLKQPINIRVKENVKKVYIVGEKVDKTNMCVEIEYDDGSIEQVTNYEVDTETSLSRVDKTRTITYKEGDITLEKEIDVPVLPAEIQKISIKQYPDDVDYVVGQKFFSNGLILLVKYADETEEEITEDFTLDLPDGSVLTKAETKTVKVNYMGQEVKFDINVKENNDIQALTIMDGSIETNYEIGEKLDLRGLVLISEGSNNDIKVIWGNYECEPAEGTELNTKGQQTITIKYAGKSAVLNINVGEHQVEEIEIENLPKTKYVVGQALDLTGLKLKVMYNNGTEEIVETGYTSSIENGTIFNNVENKTIEISYKEKTTSFDIDVVKKQVEKLKGISAPTKTKYKVGEALDLSGVKFKAIYNDGEEKEIETGYTSSIPNGTILDTIGYNPIILEYEGKTITALVFVGEIAIESISINTEPDKVVYQVGEQLDLTGLSIKAKYENGEENIIKSGFETTPEDGEELNIKGQKEVTVKLGEKTATFNVDVQGKKDAPTLTEIKIAKAPDKTKYKVGENFDKTGMVVKAIYSDGNSKEVTDYICMPEEQLEKETTEITIIYTEDTITKYAKQKIEVVEDGGGDNQGDNNNNNDNNNNDNDNSENNNNGNNSNNNNNNNNSNNGNNNNSNNNNNTNDGKNEDKVDGKIPQTGENSIMLIAGAILTVVSVIIYIKIKKFEI